MIRKRHSTSQYFRSLIEPVLKVYHYVQSIDCVPGWEPGIAPAAPLLCMPVIPCAKSSGGEIHALLGRRGRLLMEGWSVLAEGRPSEVASAG